MAMSPSPAAAVPYDDAPERAAEVMSAAAGGEKLVKGDRPKAPSRAGSGGAGKKQGLRAPVAWLCLEQLALVRSVLSEMD